MNTKTNAFCTVSLVRGFGRKKNFEPPENTLHGCHGNQSVSFDQALRKLNSRLLVQEEHGWKKGAHCAPF